MAHMITIHIISKHHLKKTQKYDTHTKSIPAFLKPRSGVNKDTHSSSKNHSIGKNNQTLKVISIAPFHIYKNQIKLSNENIQKQKKKSIF